MNEDGHVSISRRGLIAAGLAVAAVGTMGVVSTLNAGAAEVPAAAAVVPVDAPDATAPDAVAPAPVAPPTVRLPWGQTPRKMKTGRPGASSAALAASGASAALEDSAKQLEPEFAPKGHSVRGVLVKTGRTSALPPAPPAAAEPAPGSTRVNYMWSGAKQNAEADGAAARLTIGKPTVADGDWHSLGEIAVQSADEKQIVEVGWTVDRYTNGDSDPHLFVYHWVNGKETCYNGCGFVSSRTASIIPGATLPEGAAKDFGIQHINGYWWIAYDSEWIGAFPDSEWKGQYTRSGLVQFFGEVAASSTNPCTAMGTGIAPDAKGSARMYNISFVNGPDVSLRMSNTSNVYAINQSSVTSFRYGGPGAC
jgi:Neprosin